MQAIEVTGKPEPREIKADSTDWECKTYFYRGFILSTFIDGACIRPVEVKEIPDCMAKHFSLDEWFSHGHYLENGDKTPCLFKFKATLADAVRAIDAYWEEILDKP